MIPELAPIPRRTRQSDLPEKPSPTSFRIEASGEPPEIVTLSPRLAGFLMRLAGAGPEGLGDGNPHLTKAIVDLRAAGVPVSSVRARRKDGGAGWTAVYRLACAVEVLHG